jgi:uncharacterized membrane protein
MQFYQWLVFVHLVGLVLFAISHGVSIAAAQAVRGERSLRVVTARLETSRKAIGISYVALVLLGIGGLGAAWVSGQLLAPWVVASYIVLAIVLVVMWAVATPHYMRLRRVLADGSGDELSPEATVLLESRRYDVLTTVGGLGLVVLIWLMVLKPG